MIRKLTLSLSTALAALIVVVLLVMPGAPSAYGKPEAAGTTVITQWTFELSNTLPAIGIGTAISGSALTGQTFVSGNGSAWAWSFMGWSTLTTTIDPNKYLEFDVSTVGYYQTGFRFDDRRSGTGPTVFQVHYSTDGTTFTPFYTGTGHASTTWYTNTFDLSSISGLNDNPNAKFRIYGYNASSTAGTWRIDNVTVLGGSPSVDLGVAKSGLTTALAGETITYTISLSNTGTTTATGTLLTDTLPAEVTFMTYTTALPGAFTQNGQNLIWDLGDVPMTTANATIEVRVAVSSTLSNGASFTNTIAASTTYTESNQANNTDSVTTFIGSPDLVIVKTGPASVNAGDTFTYTLAYSNAGTIDATNVAIVDHLPAGVTFVTETTGSAAAANGLITWTLGGLNAGGADSILLTATARYAGDWLNGAAISGGPIDSNLANNTSSVTTTVNGADPYVLKSGPAIAFRGELITYTITYGNVGNVAATATLTDQLPISFTVSDIAWDNSGLTTVDGSGTRAWTTVITADTELSFTFALTVPAWIASSTRITNSLSIRAIESGDDPIDNTAKAPSAVYQVVPIATARAGIDGQVFAITGTVTVEPGVFTYNGQNRYLYVQDNTGGVLVYRDGGLNPVARGHIVRIVGAWGEYKAEAEVLPANAVDVVDRGPGAAVVPLVANTGSIDESVEGELVQISGQVTGKPASYRLQVNDGSGMVEVNRYYNLGQITDTNYIDFSPYNAGDYVRVVGVTRGYTESFGFTREVLPRGPADIAKYPRVLNTGPVSGTIEVPVTAGITATFNLTMTNVDTTTFLLQAPGGAVGGMVTFDSALKTATFTPTVSLAVNTRYTATLKSNLLADNGLSFYPAQDVVWTFTTHQLVPNLSTSTKTNAIKGVVRSGEWVTYTISLINTGDLNATAIVTDVLPSYYTAAQLLDFTLPTTGTLTWTGVVTAGQSVTLQFVAQVAGVKDLPLGQSVLDNSAQVTDGVHQYQLNDPQPPQITIYGVYLPLIRR